MRGAESCALASIDSTRFWDTIPSRMFIKLDDFSNPNLKVRFVVEDSAFVAPGQIKTNSMFVALDIVRIDGYLKKEVVKEFDIIIFPNPATDELFIKYDPQLEQPFSYRIIDAQGRKVREATLKNSRINVRGLSPNIYFVQFYFDYGEPAKSYKFIKQ
ncbi:MAG: T9SS type A sorting domain-containing protein [Ferruginibacter sp.]|nr:T9SS type A sorting domain-containing protein [Ferruginibacter sp.]